MRYYIADCHFFHGALNTAMDHRGFDSMEKMNEYMIRQWNNKVRPNDEVVILGDFSWGKPDETNALLERLNGRLYLILGNHDRFLTDKKYNSKRFVWIKDYEEMKDNKRKVILSHYPMPFYNGQYYKDKDGMDKTYMLHGHIHDTIDQRLLESFQEQMQKTMRMNMDGKEISIPCNIINCFCKYSDYIPLTLDEWIECDRKRREIMRHE